jgi:membrane-bound lytic murein transglycosylase B
MKNSSVRLLLLFVCFCWLAAARALAQDASPEFSAWLAQLRADARAAGISQQTLDAALTGIQAPEPRVISLDQSQPETTQSLQEYVAARVTDRRIAEGRRMLLHYPAWLERVEDRYRVQRRFIVALWGIESNYGRHTGTFPVIQALVTLAYDDRRGSYFRKELLTALQILDDGHVTLPRMRGSWAGAMGPFQFMPSSFQHYAVDADGDGRINIWDSVPDALASAANYLAAAGWRNDETWGREVRLPENFDASLAGLENRLPLARWQELGVRRADGRALPRRDLEASLILPDGRNGPAFLVYGNFRALLRWNRSVSFAVAVGMLADRLGAAD